jgi:hypothetical protein
MIIRSFSFIKNVIPNFGVNTWFFISFACPKETKQRKGHFFEGIFWHKTKNRFLFSKFSPRIRKFLTKIKLYAGKKDYLLSCLIKTIYYLTLYSNTDTNPLNKQQPISELLFILTISC